MTTEQRKGQTIRTGSIVERTEAEGPGVRFAIWVQGCSIRCPGCFNPHFWGTHGGTEQLVSDLAQRVAAANVEGITFLGGEPFEQADGLAQLAAAVRGQGLSVMTFTGYDRAFLESSLAPSGAGDLLAATDLLIDGRYDAATPDTLRPWVGSTNQRFHFLTNRYRYLEESLPSLRDTVEIRLAPDGQVTLNGWAGTDQLEELLAEIALAGGRPTGWINHELGATEAESG